MTNRIARIISILGHPAILMPLAAAIASASTGNRNLLFLSTIIVILFAALVAVYSGVKTRVGHWEHVDASIKHERKELNRTVSVVLCVGAGVAFLFNVHLGIVAAVGLSGMIVLASHCLNKVAKPSLHTSFAIFAACLTWPNTNAFTAFLLFAFFIGWSRLSLKRHTLLDLACGAVLGILAGLCFQAVMTCFKGY